MKLKVGAIYYEVSEVERLCDDTGEQRLNGHINHDKSTIQLDDDLNEWKYKEVLWHEVVHAIAIHFGIEGELNEHMVACLAKGICMVLEDNKELR
jgi:predicted Zn-dependent protease with MMP-like domain